MVLRLADSWSNWNFEGAGKTRVPGKKPLGSRERTKNKLNAHLWRRRRNLNPDHIGGRRVLSPLCHPCALKTVVGCPWPIQRNLFGSTYVWFHLFTIIMLNDVYCFFLNFFLEFSIWPRKRSERYLKIFASLLSTVSKPPHAGTIFLNVTNKTLTFKSTLRRSDNPSRKSKEKNISIKGKTT